MNPDPDRDPEALAAEFLARKAAGELVDAAEYARHLSGEAARREFEALVAGASRAERGLPHGLDAGSRIAGRYRIRASIGSGGMGRVFSAFDETLGRAVAVKVLAPLAQGNREREQMFEREWRMLADLKHPGIVAVHDAGNDGDFTYIVMDLVEGTAISDVIDRARKELEAAESGGRRAQRTGELLARAIARAPEPGRRGLLDPHDAYRSAARILLEIARTLEAAHERKVVHRDLKPANVMLLGGGFPVVLDFGLAGSPEFSTGGVTEGLYGSVAYLAPEQAKNQKVGMDPRTDVYQLGLILYEMLTLQRAFSGTAIGTVLEKIQRGDYVPPRKLDPAIPVDLEAICTMALELSLDRRYASARALREDLELWLEGRAPVASRSARWRSFLRTAKFATRTHPIATAAIAVVIVGAGIYAGAKAGAEAHVPFNISFFRMDPANPASRPQVIDATAPRAEPGDLLGFTLVKSEEAHVYALSVFGADDEGERYVVPYCATDAEHLERLHQAGKPWGWHISKAREDIVCTQLAGAKDKTLNAREGLLVLVSPKPVREIEEWMDSLQLAVEHRGVPYARALELLARTLEPSRGVPVAGTWEPAVRESVRDRLLAARAQGVQRLGLPGVEEFSIECRVARD
jgi:serine/threonine protein kinase